MARDQKLDRVIIQETIDPTTADRMTAAFRTLFDGAPGAEGLLAELVAHLPLAAIASDADGVVTAAYGTALERMGLDADEFVGSPVAAWGTEATAFVDRTAQGLAQVVEMDGVVDDEAFRFRIFAMPDGRGGSFAILVDLSDAFAAEQEVDANRAMLEAAIEGSGAMMFVHDANGRVLGANALATTKLGLERGQPDVAAALLRLDPEHDDGRSFTDADLPSLVAMRARQPQRNVPLTLLLDGERRRMSLISAPIRIEERDAVVTSLIDVTERNVTKDVLRDSDERFRLMTQEAPIGIFIVDLEGEILYLNPAVEELTGRSASEVRAIGWEACTHPDDLARLAAGAPLPGLDAFKPVEYRALRPDGTVRWVRSTAAVLTDDEGETIGLVGTTTDITELHIADVRLRESEQRTRAILEMAAEGIVSFDQHGMILEFNAAAERIFGYDSDEMIGHHRLLDLMADEERRQFEGSRSDPPSADPSRFAHQVRREATGRRSDGQEVPLHLAVTEIETTEGALFTAVIRDLTQQKAFERELEHLATHDSLTGLPNRALLAAQLESALTRADRSRRAVAVLFVDVDRVKLVTEALGHRAGDELIVQAAGRLRAAAPPTSTLGRFSSDQFVLFIEDVDYGEAVEVAIAAIEAINDPFVVGVDESFVSASVGIAFAIDGVGDAETLVSNADVAMGRAKASITRYEIFDTDMRAWVEGQRKTEIALRHGIERNEFELFYQPVVELATSQVCGYEALARWNHPELGLLGPSEFIPLAEESGLIVPLGQQILRAAIRQSAIWRADLARDPRAARVAINLSARQLEHPGLADDVRAALEEFGADPADLSFEITETVLLHDVDLVVQTLDELRELGVHLSLDDFGTGYSSLTYLCRLPIDTVKVDRSFVSQLGTASRDASIVEMVITMARTLHLHVVAEGVETEHQAEVLRGWGCGFAQGYLFARPTPVGDLT